MRLGKDEDARALARDLDAQLQPQARAYGKIILAERDLWRKHPADAVQTLRDALKLADVWLGHFDLGVAYIQAGHYAEGLSELETCSKRRGEAAAMFLDDRPTFRYLAPLPYWLARGQEALGMKPAAVENYKVFLAARSSATNDPLIQDARRRMAAEDPPR